VMFQTVLAATSGTGRDVGPPVVATLRPPARCQGIGRVGGDVGGLVGGDVGDRLRNGRSTVGGDAGGLVGGDAVTGRGLVGWRCRGLVGGDVGDWSRDWSVHPCGDVMDQSAYTWGPVGPVGGDVRLVGSTSGTGRDLSVHPWVATLADWSAAMSGDQEDWSVAMSTGRRRRRGTSRTGRSTAGRRRWRTGRRRCRGLVGVTGRRCRGLVGGDVGELVGGLVGLTRK
jgi:hypothetical protein